MNNYRKITQGGLIRTGNYSEAQYFVQKEFLSNREMKFHFKTIWTVLAINWLNWPTE